MREQVVGGGEDLISTYVIVHFAYSSSFLLSFYHFLLLLSLFPTLFHCFLTQP